MAAGFGLIASSAEGASSFSFVILFLPYLSSAFVPVATMPAALRGFAEHQPMTPVVETLRGLMTGTPVAAEAWTAAAWFGGLPKRTSSRRSGRYCSSWNPSSWSCSWWPCRKCRHSLVARS
jgi:ABC-2 type transport system permease protein